MMLEKEKMELDGAVVGSVLLTQVNISRVFLDLFFALKFSTVVGARLIQLFLTMKIRKLSMNFGIYSNGLLWYVYFLFLVVRYF